MRISDWSSDVCSSDLVTGRVMVERAVTDRAGESHLVLEETADAAPGEALVFQFDYRNARPGVANSFVITNPIPDQMVYAGTDTPGEFVSVDGGRSFGPIAEMKVADADGVERTATPDRKSRRLNSSHYCAYRLPSSA